MKFRTVTLAMMTLMLSAGPAMAMDSQQQGKHDQTRSSDAGSTAMQAENTTDPRLAKRAQRQETGQQRQVRGEHELTREALRYWWQ